jgi:hypothetical protein
MRKQNRQGERERDWRGKERSVMSRYLQFWFAFLAAPISWGERGVSYQGGNRQREKESLGHVRIYVVLVCKGWINGKAYGKGVS